MKQTAGAVEALLDDLFDRLAGTGAAGRRALAEAEDHLRAAVEEGVGRGLSEDAAERAAVDRFGDPGRIAGELRAVDAGWAGWLPQVLHGTWLVAGLGCLAVGLAGIVAALLGTVKGAEFVSGDAVGVQYTAARCADYFEYFPGAGSCAHAAALHHLGEVEDGRFAVGVLGILALLALWVARRTTRLGEPAARPPRGLVAVVATVLLGTVGLLLTGLGSMQVAYGGSGGPGANLADGAGALLVAVIIAVSAGILTRRRRAAWSGSRPAAGT